MYCDALVFSNRFNEETRKELDVTLRGMQASPLAKKPEMVFTIVKLKCHLSLVLQHLGITGSGQKESVNTLTILQLLIELLCRRIDYCSKYLRKNPNAVSEGTLLQLLFRQDQPTHPVLTALGGVKWLEGVITREGLSARMEDRNSKACRQCSIREPEGTLFRCSGCKYIYYW